MRRNEPSEEKDEQLHSVLREWVLDSPLPPRFQEQVWHRIERGEPRLAAGFWGGFSRWLEVVLPRPKLAFLFVSVLLVLGVAAGSIAAQVRNNQLDSELSHRYVQSLDPYRAEVPQP